jgi:hypothetical protein
VSESPARARSRGWLVAAAALTVGAGLGSRAFGAHLPRFVAEYAGDALYATLVFVLAALVIPRAKGAHLALVAFGFSAMVEGSQAVHLGVLDAVRATLPGRLVLGTTFVWSDFPCYFAGALLGLAVDTLAEKLARSRAP